MAPNDINRRLNAVIGEIPGQADHFPDGVGLNHRLRAILDRLRYASTMMDIANEKFFYPSAPDVPKLAQQRH